jgi:hypothetical protein
MLGKAHQLTAFRRRVTRQRVKRRLACPCERERRGLGPAAFLAIPIAVLALAAPASAAGSLTGVLDTVTTATAPTVEQTVSAATTLAPAASTTQKTADTAPGSAPAEGALEQTTGASSTSSADAVASELSAASTHQSQTTAGAPADRPQSAPRSGADPIASGSTLSRAIGAGERAAATITTRQRRSGPVGRVIHGVALTANRAAPGAARPSNPVPAGGALAPSRLPVVAGRLVETLPAGIATLPAPLARALTPPSLSELAALPELGSLSTLPLLAIVPSLTNPSALVTTPESGQPPVAGSTAVPPPPRPAPPRPYAVSLPAAAAAGDGRAPSTPTAPPGAWRAASVTQAYGATPTGIRDPVGAADRRGAPSSAVGAHRRASARAGSTTVPAFGSSASRETARTAPGSASSGGAYRQSPPAPGGVSPAMGAAAGASIPILLALAGLLLLAAPRVRRVLRLRGESWRMPPLSLTLERPG